MTKRRIAALLLALVMVVALTAACGGGTTETPASTDGGASSPPANTGGDTSNPAPADAPDDKVLVVGSDGMFDAKWNPFLRETVYDHYVVDQIFAPVCIINADNELEPYAGTIESEVQPDNSVIYTIKIQEGMTFTDGTPITIDDYIYGIYVRSDPSYTGPMNTLESKIEGVLEYYYDNPNYTADLKAIEEEAARFATDVITFEDFMVYAEATDLDGWWAMYDGIDSDAGGATWRQYFVDYMGYGDDLAAIDETDDAAVFELLCKVEYETALSAYDAEGWYRGTKMAEYALGNVSDGKIDVPEISGVKRIDDYTCTVHLTVIDIYADRGLTTHNGMGDLVPRHYYGEVTKGDVSKILANMNPMGSGPYIFQDYSNNIVTATANVDFFLGVPKTGTVRWQYVPQTDAVEAIVSGAVDIINPSGNLQNVAEIQANPHVRYDMIDNAGYGYMAMNCNSVDLYSRKAVWSLMNRLPSVEGYYGTELAQVIERPMTTTLAEYPDDATEYYGYSREKALEYFAEAGYTQKDGKLVNDAGEQFIINCYIGGGGSGDHPAYAMLVQAAADLAALGGELQIQDVEFNVLMSAVDDGTADMWIMAWSSVYDCDKTTQFHTNGGQNKYKFSNAEMDALLEKIPQTLDLNERRALVAEMLDLAMENCIEFPLYQRKNMLTYNGNNVDLDTIPPATTAADYQQHLWKIAVN